MKKGNYFLAILTSLPWIALLLYFTLFYPFSFNYEIEANDQYLLVLIIPYFGITLIVSLQKLIKKPLHADNLPNYSTLKLALLALTTVSLLLLLFSDLYTFSNEHFFVCSSILILICSSILFSSTSFIYPVLVSINIIFIYQLFVGLFQFWNSYQYGENPSLAIKGTLQNSGIYACYLVVCFPFLKWFFFDIKYTLQSLDKKWCKKYAQLITLFKNICFFLLVACMLFLVYKTQSRTAYIAAFTTLAAYFILNNIIKIRKKILTFPKQFIFGLLPICIFIFIGAGIYLFNLKKMSAMGRLMQLRITMDHFWENFWFGTGLGRFTWYYPQWQAQYFKENASPPRDFFLSAGESYIIFNEFLQLFKEIGLVGFLIFLVFIIYFFLAKAIRFKNELFACKLTVISFLSCGFTTYPFHTNALILILGFCLIVGIITSKKNFKIPFFKSQMLRVIFLSTILLTSFVSYKGLQEYVAVSQWEQKVKGENLDNTTARKIYKELYPILEKNGKFLTDYGLFLLRDSAGIQTAIMLEQATKYHISRETIDALGTAYLQDYNFQQAIEKLEWVSNYLPNKFRPKYNLLVAYQSVGDTINSYRIASTITNMPVKIPSFEIDQIKSKAFKVLKDYK